MRRWFARWHAQSGFVTGSRAIFEGRTPLTGTLNGLFVRQSDLARPVTQIEPLASQVGPEFKVGKAGSDLSPVGWKVLSEKGIAIRGPQPSRLNLDPEPERLAPGRLETWTPTGVHGSRGLFVHHSVGSPSGRAIGQHGACWGYHVSTARSSTGEIISKEAAGEYAFRRVRADVAAAHHGCSWLLARRASAPPLLVRRTACSNDGGFRIIRSRGR